LSIIVAQIYGNCSILFIKSRQKHKNRFLRNQSLPEGKREEKVGCLDWQKAYKKVQAGSNKNKNREMSYDRQKMTIIKLRQKLTSRNNKKR
jgi:hypothetical protein